MKKLKKFILVFAVALTAVCYGFAEIPLKEHPLLKKGTFSNGMNYYILPNKEAGNKIIIGLLVNAGSCMEDDDQQGVAHFIEHMCFNGTEHYKSRDFIDYIESIGLNWGDDLNAFTNRRNTFYYVTIPTDKKEYLEKAMLWLSDIAGGKVLFDEDELQSEKGVVIEEWRREQGYNDRYEKAVINKYYLKNTRYAERNVLGTETSIKNVSSERVKDFYKKWYRPDNMTFIAIGNTIPSTMERMSKNSFSKIQNPEEPLKSFDLSIPVQGYDAVIFSDKEQKDTIINIEEKLLDFKVPATEEDVKKTEILQFVINTFNRRLNGISKKIDSSIINAGMDTEALAVPDNKYLYVYLRPKDNQIEQAVKDVKDELIRIKKYGITSSEFDSYKNGYRSSLLETKKNSKVISNWSYVNLLLNCINYGFAFITPENDVDTRLKLLDKITLEEVNECCRNIFVRDGDLVLLRCNEKNKNDMTKEKLENLWRAYSSMVTEYKEEKLPSELMTKPAKKAAVKSKNINTALECSEYVLENGVRIIVKKTNFEKDKVYMSAFSEGGSALYDNDKDYASAYAACGYFSNSGINGYTQEQYLKICAEKNYVVNYGIYNYSEEMTGNSSWKDFEDMLQYVNLMFTNPYFTDEGWNAIQQNFKEIAKKRGVTPEDAFYDKINSIIYDDNLRYQGITQKLVDLLDKKRSEEIFRERFSNAADFTFTFVGDFDENKLIDLCCYYLGTIPGDETKKEKTVSNHVSFPKGKILETITKGEATNSNIFVGFGKDLEKLEEPVEIYKRNELAFLVKVYLGMKLTDMIREEKGGTYTVGGDLSFYNYPSANFFGFLQFGCEPSRENELLETAIECLNSLRKNTISSKDVTKLKLYYSNLFDQNKRTNNWWINRINNSLVHYTEVAESVTKNKKIIMDSITAENIQKFLTEYFDEENYTSVILTPEK